MQDVCYCVLLWQGVEIRGGGSAHQPNWCFCPSAAKQTHLYNCAKAKRSSRRLTPVTNALHSCCFMASCCVLPVQAFECKAAVVGTVLSLQLVRICLVHVGQTALSLF